MLDIQPRRLADGGIDYNHYRSCAHEMRAVARRSAARRWVRIARRLIGAALVAAGCAGGFQVQGKRLASAAGSTSAGSVKLSGRTAL